MRIIMSMWLKWWKTHWGANEEMLLAVGRDNFWQKLQGPTLQLSPQHGDGDDDGDEVDGGECDDDGDEDDSPHPHRHSPHHHRHNPHHSHRHNPE